MNSFKTIQRKRLHYNYIQHNQGKKEKNQEDERERFSIEAVLGLTHTNIAHAGNKLCRFTDSQL